MDKKEFLTTEPISKRFRSPFDLVNYAIRLAANAISTGRPMRVRADTQNLSQHILLEILNNKDVFEEIDLSVDEEPMEERKAAPEQEKPNKGKGSKSARALLGDLS